MLGIKRSNRDALTGLYDREAFVNHATRHLAQFSNKRASSVYLRLLNLDAYNVRHGASAGDKALKRVAKTLSELVSNKCVGRLESGSFVALIATEAVEDVVEQVNQLFTTTGEPDGLALKAGYCELRDDMTLEDAMVRAHYAFDDIRYKSPVYTRFFDRGLETAYNRRDYVINHLDDAIERGEIRAYAQSIVRVLTGMICEVEILSRWISEEYGFLRPDEFIPELERHQLIHKLDSEIVRLACKQWREASDEGINVPFGINLSRLDFELTDMFAVVTDAMQTYGVPVDQVHIEITESALSHSNDMLQAGIERFRRAGFELYLDDFGSGYSSLRVLEGKSFDVVKLDMSLLAEVEYNERARVIVSDAVSMVKRLNLQTLCEGVETAEQFAFLKGVGCEKAQGYFFAKPMSHEEIMAHLEETAHLHESAEDKRYYDSIGKINLIDGTRTSVHGVEAAHFVGSQPFAIIEIKGESISFLLANVAFTRFVGSSNIRTIDRLVERLSTDLSTLRNKALYAASKATSAKETQQFDFVYEGNFCTAGISPVEQSVGRRAFLLEVLSVTRYSKLNDFKLLESSMRFLYTIFKRIDLLDVTDNTWHNIYLNVPRYNPQRPSATPRDEIEAVCEAFIHPEDRARFLDFYDLDTVEERLANSPTVHLADVFFTLSDKNRYENQLFMIIPVSMGDHQQYLSCMRDLDTAGLVRQNIGGADQITDDILLSGILDVTERLVFWKDKERRYLGANQRFLDYYGFSTIEAILGKTDENLGWTHNPGFLSDDCHALRGERVLDEEGITERRGELRRIRVSKMPLWREGKAIGLVGFLVDEGPYESGRRSSPEA